jgi:hypothetical protein
VILGVLSQLEPFKSDIPKNAFLCTVKNTTGVVKAVVLQYSSWHGVMPAFESGMGDDEVLACFRLAVYEMRRKQVRKQQGREGNLEDPQHC